ncbi:MAG: LptF/LptG family permease [Pleomorphochaeta sp.]
MVLKLRKKQLFKYIGKEYLLAFLVSFVFFFFIFFINQILLLARRILLSNVDFFSMIHLVVLAIPQFLLYTFPFASLSGASMVIGALNSSNEILALRSSGFSIKNIFSPIIILSIVISILCFLVADILMPYSASQYQQLYIQLLTKSPGVELKSNSSNVYNDFLITNGDVKDNNIDDIVLLSTTNNDVSLLAKSDKGKLNYIDINQLIYSLDLNQPTLLISDLKDPNNWQLSTSDKGIYYIDFSSSLNKISASLPSNLSSVDLLTKINKNKPILSQKQNDAFLDQSSIILNLSKNYATNKLSDNLNINNFVDDYNYIQQINLRPIDFYLQYYRAEFYKKFALSAACFFFIFITIPLSYMKFKHGRLVGFGLSMLIAVLYWYMILIAQLRTFSYAFNPLFLMWAPNIIVLLIAIVLIRVWRN